MLTLGVLCRGMFSVNGLNFSLIFTQKLLYGFRRLEIQWQVKRTTTMYFLKLENFSSNCMEKGHKYIIQNIYFCLPQKKHSHTWDDIKVSKWWQNLNFWVNGPFKLLLSNASLHALQEIHICWCAPWDNNQATPRRSSKLYWVCNLLSNVVFSSISLTLLFPGECLFSCVTGSVL